MQLGTNYSAILNSENSFYLNTDKDEYKLPTYLSILYRQ